jgi:very-short-patch-repair endonuclease
MKTEQTISKKPAVLRSPSPPSGERVGVRGRAIKEQRSIPKLPHTAHTSSANWGSGEPLQYGKYRTRTTAARNFARKLRETSTDAEKKMWRLLRSRHFAEFKFRRQYSCGIYFLDFFCTIAKLAVELDGGGHGFPDQRTKDEKRNQFLSKQGIKVLRFWNHKLRGELEAVRFEIWHALMERTGQKEKISIYLPKPAAPSPQPSPPVGAREAEPLPSIERPQRKNEISKSVPKSVPSSQSSHPVKTRETEE